MLERDLLIMVDTIRKTMLLGIGAAALTRDRIEQFIGDSVARGELNTEQGKSLVEEMTQRAEQERQRLETFVTQQINRALENTGLTTRSEVTRLESRIVALESRVRDLSFAGAIGGSPAEDTTAPAAGPLADTNPSPTPPISEGVASSGPASVSSSGPASAPPSPPSPPTAPITVSPQDKKTGKA